LVQRLLNDPRAGWSVAAALVVGYQWLESGWGKFSNPKWMQAGEALALLGLARSRFSETGRPPITFDWYRTFIQKLFRCPGVHLVFQAGCGGELLIGAALIRRLPASPPSWAVHELELYDGGFSQRQSSVLCDLGRADLGLESVRLYWRRLSAPALDRHSVARRAQFNRAGAGKSEARCAHFSKPIGCSRKVSSNHRSILVMNELQGGERFRRPAFLVERQMSLVRSDT
jgi:hypothetical protein